LSDIRNYLLLQTIAPTLHTVRPPSPSVTWPTTSQVIVKS
jgi:hypothetical protein